MKILVFVFFMIPVISLGQPLSIDFESSNLTGWYQPYNTHWCLSGENAIGGNYSLTHCYDDTVSGCDWIGYIHSPVDLEAGPCRWDFMLRYDHNPSSSNNWAVFLSDHSFPDQHGRLVNGLVLGVNYEGNTDELMIWKVSDGKVQVIFNTGFNWQENISSHQVVSFSIDRSENGLYTIALDTSGTGYFILGSLVEHSISTINTIILYYRYTATYDLGFSFDNLLIDGSFTTDNESPYIVQVAIISPHKIEVQFSEPVTTGKDETWRIDDIGCCETTGNISDRQQLFLTNPLTPGNFYQLHTPTVTDASGNSIEADNRLFTFYYPGSGDVIINEIFADPSPPVMLPEAEYIELYNVSSENIWLNNWKLFVNTRGISLPPFILPSRKCVVLCDREFAPQFNPGLFVISVGNMPALRNSGAQIRLQDQSGKLIHAIEYSDEWFNDSHKKEGGWSLEMIDPTDPCAGSMNWKESESYKGGTPGEKNSVFQPKQISKFSTLWRAAVSDSGSLMLYFSKPLDSSSVANRQFYSIDHAIGNPSSINVGWPFTDKVELCFNDSFHAGNNYEIKITSDLCDCSGARLLETMNTFFAVPEPADSGDILINEIMYDPEEGLNEYIELYNNSQKTIDIKNYCLIIGEPEDSGRRITEEHWPLMPGTYAIITTKFENIDRPGIFDQAGHIIYMSDMPILPNSGSKVFLLDQNKNILDVAFYEPTQHHDIYTDTKGISLERISPERSGLDGSNWHSASSDAGYMTPAKKNSQTSDIVVSSLIVNVTPEAITPVADGKDDELTIFYRMDKPGYMVRIMIFDIEGQQMAILANGQLSGVEGTYVFNGRDTNGNILPTGFYALYFEAYNDQGDRHVTKKAFVVTR